MRVLAKGQNNFVVSMTRQEMAQLHGFNGVNAQGYVEPNEQDNVQIDPLFQTGQQQARNTQGLKNIKDLCMRIINDLSQMGV